MKFLKMQLISFLLILSIAVATSAEGTATLSTGARSVTLSRYTQSVDIASQTIGVTIRAESFGDTPLSCAFYSVLSNEDGTADSISVHPAALQPGTNLIPIAHPYQTGKDSKRLKIYCWNNNMQPMSNPLVFSVPFDQTITAIDLSTTKTSLILATNETGRLTYTLQPAGQADPGVVFTSDAPDIVSVDATGLLTPKAPGKAVITALTKNRTAYATCEVTVISDITRLSLNKTSVTLGGSNALTYQLKATVTPEDAPDKTVIFTSSDPQVVSVSQTGLLQQVSVGEATVTATTGDGAASALCKVTALAIPTGIKLNKSSLVMWDYGMYTLKASVTGIENATVRWTSSDDSIATVSDQGIVYGVAKGTATITASVGSIKATCKVSVHRECDYIGTIAAYFESKDNPASISGSGTGKCYGCFQLYAGSNGPKKFYNWLITSEFNPEIGRALKAAHKEDGGEDNVFGENFDALWKELASTQKEEFRSCQMAYTISGYYEPIVSRLVTDLDFYVDNYGLALKAAILSRAIQHGTGGAFNRVRDAFESIGGFNGKTEKELITAIYKECGAVVSEPPSSTAIPMNSSSSIAVEYGLVGKYMKYYSGSSSSTQAGVWKRLNITELNMLYDMLENPPVVITQ